jgi:hypothetical protein
MAKWADYLISHVGRDSSGNVLKVLLHTDNGENVSTGIVRTKEEVIALLKKGYSIKTMIWIYPNWKQGAEVQCIKGTYGEFLRTDSNKTDSDNLDNLILLY